MPPGKATRREPYRLGSRWRRRAVDPSGLMDDVRTLFRTCRRLEEATGLPFGPDGYTLGSAGEVIAAWAYDLQLVDGASNAGYDAVTTDRPRLTVQVKATTKGPGEAPPWRDAGQVHEDTVPCLAQACRAPATDVACI